MYSERSIIYLTLQLIQQSIYLKTEKPNVEESKTTAIEGLERALKKITEIDEKFDNLTETFGNELNLATSDFHI